MLLPTGTQVFALEFTPKSTVHVAQNSNHSKKLLKTQSDLMLETLTKKFGTQQIIDSKRAKLQEKSLACCDGHSWAHETQLTGSKTFKQAFCPSKMTDSRFFHFEGRKSGRRSSTLDKKIPSLSMVRLTQWCTLHSGVCTAQTISDDAVVNLADREESLHRVKSIKLRVKKGQELRVECNHLVHCSFPATTQDL